MKFNIRSLNPATTSKGSTNALVRIDIPEDIRVSKQKVRTNARNDVFFPYKIDDEQNAITLLNPNPKQTIITITHEEVIIPKGKYIALLAVMPATALITLPWHEAKAQSVGVAAEISHQTFKGVTAISDMPHFTAFTHDGFKYDQHSVRIFHYAMQNSLFEAFGKPSRVGGAAVMRGSRKHAGFDSSRGSKKLIAWKPLKCYATYWDVKGGGNTVTVTDGDFAFTVMHLVKAEKEKDAQAGDYIATMGTTGRSSGDHWHIKVSYGKHNQPTAEHTYTMANGLQAYFAYALAVSNPNQKVLWGAEGSQSRKAAIKFLESMKIEVPTNF